MKKRKLVVGREKGFGVSLAGMCLVTRARQLPKTPTIEILHTVTKSSSLNLTMDSLDGSEWDVLIVGTGLQQSLLAL